MVDADALKNLEKLNQLKNDGIISDVEFERSKERLLFGGGTRASTVSSPTGNPAANDYIGWMLLPLKRYAQFEGRASRKEFWMFQLVPLVLFLVTGIMVGAAGQDEYGDMTGFGSFTVGLFMLALIGLFVPQLAVQVRRFHDQDRSGWFALLNLIPYIGMVIVLVMMLLQGTDGDNRFGENPAQA
jgi:uncharacterized membrane protein YhaH (DUF805 family)